MKPPLFHASPHASPVASTLHRLAALCLLLAVYAAQAASQLPKLVIDPEQVSVSGLSSGGFMAVQVHVAFSSTFRTGAGVVAGGPFDCAQGSLSTAIGPCMANRSPIPVDSLVGITDRWAASGAIDPTANLARSKVYLFSGSQDTTVRPGVMDSLDAYYAHYIPPANLVYKRDIAAEHAMVTDDYGNACNYKGPPFINNCGFDLAGAILQQLYGTLNPRNNGSLGGQFIEFDQTEFLTNHGLGRTGWLYVPADCRSGQACRLHVVFHGCHQNTGNEGMGDQYVRHTGYNRWADTNRIVVMYPQTGPDAINGCWDWWGYDDLDYARKSGRQMAAIKKMVDRVMSGTPPADIPPPTNLRVGQVGRREATLHWDAIPGVRGYRLYRDGGLSPVNTRLITGTAYIDRTLQPGTAYRWTVRSVDSGGREGADSAPVSATTTGTAVACYTASNLDHVLAGRAHDLFGLAYANGSNQGMGWDNVFIVTTLKQSGGNRYVIGRCEAAGGG